MREPANISEVAGLKPQYIGFILYEGSPRYVSIKAAAGLVKSIPSSIKKTGVIVNEPVKDALRIAQSGIFDLLQLHGNESPDYCKKLSEHIDIIKAFTVLDRLPENLRDYEPFCAMFLFDTAGSSYGGTGKKFDHSILKEYSGDREFILGGGITPEDPEYIKSVKTGKMAGVDLNSRFEIRPGVKDVNLLKNFIEKIRKYESNDR